MGAGKIQKGEVRNPKGRPKGAKNKITQRLRQLVGDYTIEAWDSLISDINATKDPKDRAKLKIELIKLVLPKEHNIESDTDIQVILKRREPESDS